MSFHCRAINFMEVIKEWSSVPVLGCAGGLGAALGTPRVINEGIGGNWGSAGFPLGQAGGFGGSLGLCSAGGTGTHRGGFLNETPAQPRSRCTHGSVLLTVPSVPT